MTNPQNTKPAIHIIFDGPPSHQSGRFIETEDAEGNMINVGRWNHRADGLWELIIEQTLELPTAPEPVTIDDVAMLCDHGYAICSPCDHVPSSWKVRP